MRGDDDVHDPYKWETFPSEYLLQSQPGNRANYDDVQNPYNQIKYGESNNYCISSAMAMEHQSQPGERANDDNNVIMMLLSLLMMMPIIPIE